jgi:hypothetical protein
VNDEPYDFEKESLDNSEPPFVGPFCPLCGTEIHWGWNPGDSVRCGGCGADVKPRPTLVKGAKE